MISIQKLITFVVIGFAALTPTSVFAASDSLTAHVPFPFVVDGRTLPPGSYQIESSESGAVLCIRNNKTGVLVASSPESATNSPAKPGLVFERHGSAIYLVGIHMSANGNRSLTPSFRSEPQPAPVALR